MIIKYKLFISTFVLGVSVAAIFYAWSPLLVTYVPIGQAYNFSSEQAKIIEGILASRNKLQSNALQATSVLIMANLLISLALIWVGKRNVSQHT